MTLLVAKCKDGIERVRHDWAKERQTFSNQIRKLGLYNVVLGWRCISEMSQVGSRLTNGPSGNPPHPSTPNMPSLRICFENVSRSLAHLRQSSGVAPRSSRTRSTKRTYRCQRAQSGQRRHGLPSMSSTTRRSAQARRCNDHVFTPWVQICITPPSLLPPVCSVPPPQAYRQAPLPLTTGGIAKHMVSRLHSDRLCISRPAGLALVPLDFELL